MKRLGSPQLDDMAMLAYFNGNFVPKGDIAVSPDDRGFLFGDGVYEVIRSYGGNWFRLDDHFERLARSMRELRITGIEVDSLREVSQRLLQENGLASDDATVYIQITRGAAPRTHVFPAAETSPTVYATVKRLSGPVHPWTEGKRIILVPDTRWSRCDIKSVALLPNVLAQQEAKERGADEAVFVRDGALLEGTHTNVAAVVDGELLTAPLSNQILPGVTRKVVLELCADLGISVREFPLLYNHLDGIQEMMLMATSLEVAPVVSIDGRPVGDGKPGRVTTALHEAVRALTGPRK